MYHQNARKKWPLLLIPILLALTICPSGATTLAQGSGDDPIAVMTVETTGIEWQPQVEHAGLLLTISSPDGLVYRQEFEPGDVPTFGLVDADGQRHPDGAYTYELQAAPVLDEETRAALIAARESGDSEAVAAQLRQAGKLPQPAQAASGRFAIRDGAFVTGSELEPQATHSPVAPQDILHNDDVIIQGALCVGSDDCVNGESFGFDTLKLEHNSIRLYFNDTSTFENFPTNDWRIVINDIDQNGADYFAIEDTTAGRNPFTIEAASLDHALYVSKGGGGGQCDKESQVGLGTSTPAEEFHIYDGDTPTIRLDQHGSCGWAPRVWDIAGNETNFFIRDASQPSDILPFRIKAGAPDDSLIIESDGSINFAAGATLDANGNLALDGALTELSDASAKENFVAIDGQDMLARLADVPITTWNYIEDDDAVRHMGPMAQDFYAAFALGPDERHVAPLDANGVALAAAQELYQTVQAQDAQIEQLEQRIAALEALVETMLQAQQN